MSGMVRTVLILDDDNAVRESLADFFEDRGWLVIPAASAEEALDVLTRKRPGGAIVDIRLPGMDGNDFIRSASRLYSQLAYVICTGSPEYRPPEDIIACPQVSQTVFTKPVSVLAEMEEALHRQIEICTRRSSADE